MTRRIDIALFGAYRVTSDGVPVTQFEASTARALLAYLAIDPDWCEARPYLASLLWGAAADATSLTNLRSAIRRARNALDAGQPRPAALLADRESVRLNLDVVWRVDVQEFERQIAAVKAHRHPIGQLCPDCIARLGQATALYTGPFLADLRLDSETFEQWRWDNEERLRRMAVQGLYVLADMHLRLGWFDDAEQAARSQLTLEPWNEEAHRQLMRSLFASGQRSAALAQYDICRQVLADELGAVPSEETDTLYNLFHSGFTPLKPPNLISPYRGLAAFGATDAGVFFGREAITQRLINAVGAQNLTILIGSSGSGKSSVINAGVIAWLSSPSSRGMAALTGTETHPKWHIANMRPGTDPVAALADAIKSWPLRPADAPALVDRLLKGEVTLQDLGGLSADPSSVWNTSPNGRSGSPESSRLLLIVDQFEEIFTLCTDPAVRSQLIDALVDAPHQAESYQSVSVLISMRADFMGPALQYGLLADALQAHTVLLGPMARSEMERAIEEPARLHGVGFEPGLTDRLLYDVGEEPGRLPLLQFALALLWQHQVDGWITRTAYEEIEGVKGALSRYADGIYARLQPDEQLRARRIFLALVQSAGVAQDVGHIATRSQLGEEQWLLAGKLATDRLLVTDRAADGEELIELAHEALIREWRQLREWLETDREFQTWQQRMRRSCVHWKQSEFDGGALLQINLLAEAERWSEERSEDIDAAVHQYIAASIALRGKRRAEELDRQQRELQSLQAVADAEHRRAEVESAARLRLRRLTVALVVATAVAALAAGVTLWALQAANAQRTEAQASAKLALARQLSAQAIKTTDSQIDLALLLGLEALAFDPTDSDRSGLLTELSIDPKLTQILHGVPGPLYTLGFGADGRLLASNEQGGVPIWTLPEGRLTSIVSSSEGKDSAAAVSPRGDRFATADGPLVTLYDGSATKLAVLDKHTDAINRLAFTYDGRYLLSSGADGQVLLWDSENGELVDTLMVDNDRPVLGPVSADGRIILLDDHPDDENALDLWDSANMHTLGQALAGHTDAIHAYAVSADGLMLATASFDGTARLWDAHTGQPKGEPLTGHTGRVLFVAFRPDGKVLATGGTDGKIVLWDLATRTPLGAPLTGHNDWVRVGRFSPDGHTLATGDAKGDVFLWDADQWSYLRGHSDRVRSLALCPDNETLVTGGFDKKLVVWDATNLNKQRTLETEHANAIIRVAYSPDGHTLASVDAGGGVVFWDTTRWEPRFPLRRDRGTVLIGLAFSPDGKTLATGGFDGIVQRWDVVTGTKSGAPIAAHKGWALSLRYSPDGARLISGGADGTIKMFDTKNGNQIGDAMTGHKGWVTDLEYAPDGQSIVSASADGDIRVWDAGSGQVLGNPMSGHNAQVWSVQFHIAHGAPVLVSLGGDGKVIRWDWATRQPLGPPLLTQRETEEMTLSSDGKQLYMASFEPTALVIRLDTVPWPERACGIANRNFTWYEWKRYMHDSPYVLICPGT